MRSAITGIVMAAVVAAATMTVFAARQESRDEVQLRAAIKKETVDGDVKGALAIYQQVAKSGNRALAAKALLRLGECHEKLGDTESRKAYERIVRDFADQKDVAAQARARLSAMAAGSPALGKSSAGLELPVADEVVWTLPVGWNLLGTPGGLAADGRHFGFTKPADNGLWLHDVLTGSDTRLIPDEPMPGNMLDMEDPVFSPDGKYIAYPRNVWGGNAKRSSDLRVIGVDGSQMRVVLDARTVADELKAEALWTLGWTPDGKRVCVVPYGRNSETLSPILVSVANGAIQKLTHIRSNKWFDVGFSPDGKYLAYTTQADRRTFVAPLEGTASVSVLDGPVTSQFVTWTNDGQHVVLMSDRSETNDLWSIRVVDGKPVGEPERLNANVPLIRRPTEQGETTKAPLGMARDGSFYYLTEVRGSDIYVADIDPGTGRVTSTPQRYNREFVGESAGARWSHDGQFLAYTVGRTYSSDKGAARARLVVKSVQTGNEKEFRLAPILARNVWQWFPDGQSVIVDDQDSGHTVWHRFDLQTERPSLLFDAKGMVSVPAATDLSPDGGAFFYSSCDACRPDGWPSKVPSHWRLIRRELRSGLEKALFEATDEWTPFPLPSVSPDGRMVMFGSRTNDEWVVRLIPADGGPARELYRAKVQTTPRAWTRDGRHVLVVQPDSRTEEQQLLVLSLDGGAPVPAGLTMPAIDQVSVHPDGRRLAFSSTARRWEVRVIRNLLPAAKK